MKNQKYDDMLEFYQTLWEFIGIGGRDEAKSEPFPQWLADILLTQFEKVKGEISVKEFTMETAKQVYSEFDCREGLSESAFKDLAPHLRDEEARTIIRNFFDISGTSTTDDIYIHVRNVRPLENTPGDAAVVTLVVDSYSTFKALLDKDESNRPECIHSSFSPKALVVE